MADKKGRQGSFCAFLNFMRGGLLPSFMLTLHRCSILLLFIDIISSNTNTSNTLTTRIVHTTCILLIALSCPIVIYRGVFLSSFISSFFAC